MERTVDETEAGRRQAPDTMTLLVCGTCGRTDRFTAMTSAGKHYSLGKRCAGRPVPVKYRKART